jgi:hypothetical protein
MHAILSGPSGANMFACINGSKNNQKNIKIVTSQDWNLWPLWKQMRGILTGSPRVNMYACLY